MKVALYYPWIYLTSGAERTILRLVEHSRHEWVLFTNHYDQAHTFTGFANLNVVELPRISVERSIGQTAITCWKILRQKLPLGDGFDAMLVFCEGVGDLVLFRNREVPALNICLTPLRIAFDEVYQQRWCSAFSWVSRVAVQLGSMLFRVIDRAAWRRYSRIFCISNEVKRRVINGGLAKAEDIEILYPCLGVSPENPRPEYHPFFLLPGRIMWTKNVELGIVAFQSFRRNNPQFAHFRLVVAGMVDEKSKPYYEGLRRLASPGSNVDFHVFPSDAELSELYRTCYATLFTAFNEDYGIVPLEGMAYGKACIAVDRGGPRDTVIAGVNGFLEEPDPEVFANRMAALAQSGDVVKGMGSAALAHARTFDWADFAARVDSAIETSVNDIEKLTQRTGLFARLLDRAPGARTVHKGEHNT